jgi:hypothetical protein
MEVPAVLAKTVTIRKERQRILPPNKFAGHRKNRTVRVQSTFTVQHFHRSLDGVQNNDVLTQNLDMRNITYRKDF